MLRFIILFTILLNFCSFSYANEMIINKNIEYPYIASESRTDEIKKGYQQIEPGMSVDEAIKILDKPDETRPLYEPKIKKPKQIGYTHWYILQRLKEAGSQLEKNEVLVRISYDLNWKVIVVDHWGFD